MAKVKGLDDLLRKLERTIYDEIVDDEVMKEIAAFVKDRIYKKTKSGVGPDGEKFKPLADKYVKQRKKHKQVFPNETGERFGPAKSNLTFSGQMLDALDTEIKDKRSRKTLDVFVKDSRRVAKSKISEKDKFGVLKNTKRVARATSQPTNKEVADFVSKDRPFLGLDDTGLQRIKSMLRKKLRTALKRK